MTASKTYQSLEATLAHEAGNLLGEGPVWHAARQSFFWVDIEGKKLSEMQWPQKQVRYWQLPQRIGMVVPYKENKLVVALQDGLAFFDLETALLSWLVDVEKDKPENRPNDGKCDSEGRLWLGTMHVEAKQKAGALYCINELKLSQQLSCLTVANGMAWSADNKYFYFIDSSEKKVNRYFFNAAEGRISFDRTIITTQQDLGLPDGMTMDAEGMLWIAQWDGFCVCRWNPDTGALLAKIALPVPQVSSCTFGGKDLDVLFITTARVGLTEQALSEYPQSGHVFTCEPGVKGLLPNKFKDFDLLH